MEYVIVPPGATCENVPRLVETMVLAVPSTIMSAPDHFANDVVAFEII